MHGMISIMMGLKNREKLCIIHGETKSLVGGGWVGGCVGGVVVVVGKAVKMRIPTSQALKS